MFHDKMHGTAPFPTTETFTDVFRRGNAERGGFLVVEGAQTNIVHAPFSQGDEVRNDFDNIGAVEDFIYGGLVYHVNIKI